MNERNIEIADTDSSDSFDSGHDEEFERKRDDAMGGWTDIRDNPSGTRFYKLRGTALKIFDRKVLAFINEQNAKEVIDSTLRKHIHGVSPENLLFPERKWLIFWLRFHSFSNSAYMLDWVCGKCGTAGKRKTELSDFKITRPREDLKMTGNSLELASGKTAVFKMETVGLHDEIAAFVESSDFSNNAEKAATFEIATMAALLEEFDGQKRSGIDNGAGMEFINGLNAADYDEMQEYVDKTLTGWGVSNKIEAVCSNPKCGGMTALAVTFRRDFFVAKN